jgi:hypothetical protein
MKASNDRRRVALDWFANHPIMSVRPWPGGSVDGCRYDAGDVYVETYWLPILGPSAVLAVRRIALWLEAEPTGVNIDLVELGASLGVGTGTGRHTQINRTLTRLIDFGVARIAGEHLEVHTTFPPLPTQLRRRLPLSLLDTLAAHERRTLTSP